MRRDHLRAIGIMLIYVVFFVLATPGIDGLPKGFLDSQQKKDKLAETVPKPLVHVAAWMMDLNRSIRLPLLNVLAPIQPPLRLEQTWMLYGDGPDRVRRLEVLIDDEVVYRTEHDVLDWREATFRMRRLRPMPSTIVSRCPQKRMVKGEWVLKNLPVNRIGLSRVVLEWALQDFPEAQRVELRAISGPYPGHELIPSHGVVRQAPDWELEDVMYEGGSCR